MKAKNVDVYVLIKDDHAPTAIAPVIEQIGKTKGVRKAHMNHHVQSLLAVEYDPESISCQAILASIRQQGYHASLIGM